MTTTSEIDVTNKETTIMTDKELSPVESLHIIEAMIQRTNRRLQRDSWRPFLVWGYTTVAVTLLVYFLMPVLGRNAFFFWFAIPVIGAPIMMFTGGISSAIKWSALEGRSPMDRFISVIWTVLGINCLLCSVLAPGRYILFIVLLLMNMGAMMTAMATRFRLLLVASCIGMVMSYLMLLIRFDGRDMLLFFALSFVLVFIIPGHILMYRLRKEVKQNGV